MNDTYAYTDEHDHVQTTGGRWPVIRLSLNGAAAVLAVLAFAFLVLELRGEVTTSVTAWVLLGFLLFLLAGQVVLMFLGRDHVQVRQDAATAGAEETWGSPGIQDAAAQESLWDSEAGSEQTTWDAYGTETATDESRWAPPQETGVPEAEQEAPDALLVDPAEELLTIGCPACNNTFHMSESDIAGGQFHCPKCGVAGYLGE